MEHVGQILQGHFDRQGQTSSTRVLSFKEMAELPFSVTPKEAEELGFAFKEDPPEPIQCEFCGSKLEPIGRRAISRAEIERWSGYQDCQCRQAVAKREAERIAEEMRRREEEEAERRYEFQLRVKRLFDQSKMGERFKRRTFSNYNVTSENRAAYETAVKYASNFQKYKEDGIGLIFNGTCGTGKTHLAAAIANHLINNGIPVVFGTTITLLSKLKESYDHATKESESKIIDLYSTVDLLILDDLGKERPGEWTLEKLYLIINSRYENNLPIVVTTNYTIDELADRLTTNSNFDAGEAITSRLWEMCRGVLCDWQDYRKAS